MVLNRLVAGELTSHQAATMLKLSERQLRRLKGAYGREGPAALVHGNRGRQPAHTVQLTIRDQVIAFAQGKYHGFNHQHLTEKLVEVEGLQISRSSVRRMLLGAGIRTPRQRRPPRHRGRRERLPQEGLMLQADGSRHQWLGPDGPWLTLIGGIDDATGTVPSAVFREQEDAQGYMLWLRDVVDSKGIPLTLYVDRHGIFVKTTKRSHRSLEEQLSGKTVSTTQFGRVVQDLGITAIYALSPQGKGRVERLWGTFQDRLSSELRLAGATTLAEANAVLARFVPDFNARFAVPAAKPGSAYRPLPEHFSSERVFCFKYTRTVAADNTVQLGSIRLQLEPTAQRLSFARAHVEVHERLDGSIAVYYDGTCLASKPAPAEAPILRARHNRARSASPAPLPAPDVPVPVTPATIGPRRPAANHPWRNQSVSRPSRTNSLNT